ncbi:uncharacterized protein LOC132830553 isoform X1 [Hemiscyllium ocellatum]|uniref:uncharacterized protein LOC132830553 isoform X1 n=1 Tax=Hemiscyllium ocellatum TaxID=170820 RepID=UPI0029665907|nr:uncharacterized protein LOC132830553 isoform X1 [Hemiscyllium ocellatum]
MLLMPPHIGGMSEECQAPGNGHPQQALLDSSCGCTVTKAQQHLLFLRQLRKFDMMTNTLANFYRCAIKTILSGCITTWYGNYIIQDPRRLQGVVNSVRTIIKANLPSLESIYQTHCQGKAASILKDPTTSTIGEKMVYWKHDHWIQTQQELLSLQQALGEMEEDQIHQQAQEQQKPAVAAEPPPQEEVTARDPPQDVQETQNLSSMMPFPPDERGAV